MDIQVKNVLTVNATELKDGKTEKKYAKNVAGIKKQESTSTITIFNRTVLAHTTATKALGQPGASL